MAAPHEDITIEALTVGGDTVGVQVVLYGVPVHYVAKTVQVDLDTNPVGPCEMWLNWGATNGRLVRRALDGESVSLT